METFPTLESALNDRFRGHSGRDWSEWQGRHAYSAANDIPFNASIARIGRWGHIYGLPLLPLHEAESQWSEWNRVLDGFNGNRYEIPGAGWPEGAVDASYINPRWIPRTHDGSGNHIGLDFDPWPGGRHGQIILYGRDEDVKAVLAPSLGAFLRWIAGLLESGNFRLNAALGERVLREVLLKEPASNSFHEGARLILQAPGPFL